MWGSGGGRVCGHAWRRRAGSQLWVAPVPGGGMQYALAVLTMPVLLHFTWNKHCNSGERRRRLLCAHGCSACALCWPMRYARRERACAHAHHPAPPPPNRWSCMPPAGGKPTNVNGYSSFWCTSGTHMNERKYNTQKLGCSAAAPQRTLPPCRMPPYLASTQGPRGVQSKA